jgi:hypothetical protein
MKNILIFTIGSHFFHKILYPLKIFINFSNAKRKQLSNIKKQSPNYLDLTDLSVKNGPFKGLKYPEFSSYGSSIYPKIIGTYEMELWHIWDLLFCKNYKRIIDIGCAEGYYALGLGRLFPDSTIIAYDISDKARELCMNMSIHNNLRDRLELKSKCESFELSQYDYSLKTLIVCDCEGYELDLFEKIDSFIFTNVDLVIETHDFININISTILKSKFSKTHDIISVKSIDDIEKALTYSFIEINHLSLLQKKIVLAENRPSIMEWVICLSRSNSLLSS